ncbi:Elongation factor Ts, mitochondrial [Termitomyces sp. J132]|nr:hypothetical protein C0989_005723 [Termitomyces sp. Mn162]KAH0591083.1 hypothetical protein H2248_001189 [Termitomyces sp. 'cryptogamus']KNZ80671.1 Elongation factor Ts, mitochondrial [Termitomyces sp. J132]
MLRSCRYATCLFPRRLYSTKPPKPPKVPAALVGQLRKLVNVSLIKAREALRASNNDVELALQWLEKDLAVSGAAQAAKLEGRSAGEGVISTVVLSKGAGSQSGGLRAAMVELNCETDFVGRTENFSQLADGIARTAAFLPEQDGAEAAFYELPLDLLNNAPLMSESNNPWAWVTVENSIQSLIAQVGEKISLRRAVTINKDFSPEQGNHGLSLGTYNHGGSTVNTQGRVGSLALLSLQSPKLPELLVSEAFTTNLTRLERSLARQIAGFPTTSITLSEGQEPGTALYHQDFMMFPDYSTDKVEVALKKWGLAQGLVEGDVSVVGFKRWTVGEDLDAQTSN